MDLSVADQLRTNVDVPIDAVRAFCAKWGMQELDIFGSALRDDFGPESDIDVLVTPGPDMPRGFRPRMMMEDELSELFGRRVELVYISGLVNPFRREEILRTTHTLYAAA